VKLINDLKKNIKDFANLVPNLLSQLLNPAMMATSGRWPPSTPQSSFATNASQVPPGAAAAAPPQQHHHHHLLHNVMHQQHHNNAMQGATGGGGAEGGSATRFQFVVPGEQVDLYG
jgi:hypothetical protein